MPEARAASGASAADSLKHTLGRSPERPYGDAPSWPRWANYALLAAGAALAYAASYHPGPIIAAAVLIVPLAAAGLVLAAPAAFEAWKWARGRVIKTIDAAFVLAFGAPFVANIDHPLASLVWPLLPAIVFATLGYALGAVARGRAGFTAHRQLSVMLAICGAAYGYAGSSLANIQLDPSPGAVIPVKVLGKFTDSPGRYHATIYYHFHVPAWGPRTSPNDVPVSEDLYEALEVGDQACVTSHAGLLWMPWFTVARCAGQRAGPSKDPPGGDP